MTSTEDLRAKLTSLELHPGGYGWVWTIASWSDDVNEWRETEYLTNKQGQGRFTRHPDGTINQTRGHLQFALPCPEEGNRSKAIARICFQHAARNAIGESGGDTFALCWEPAGEESAWVIRSRREHSTQWERVTWHDDLFGDQIEEAKAWAARELEATGRQVQSWKRDQAGDLIAQF